MDFNEAAVFVKVVQSGSFSAAARQLGLPTSTISTRVARLEKRLGVTLLQRTTRRLHLTESGSLYYEQAALGLGY
jgi:DNA-binding transcriptional LysR family regulator